MMLAVETGNLEVVKWAYYQGYPGIERALEEAIDYDLYEIADWIFSEEGYFDDYELEWSVNNGDIEQVKKNVGYEVSNYAMYKAAKLGDYDILKLLIKNGGSYRAIYNTLDDEAKQWLKDEGYR